ncbi:head GIN domain-containing protein [Niabella insulamsoli]|uniref:head GIN domain-containing protein n=1 Tax=Niabella insulamsoli TaxID=3144874 RepID=UPI0031FD5E27
MKYLGIAILAIVALNSCNIIDQQRIKGNGKVTSKTYNLKDFSQIDVGESMDIYLKQANEFSVKIETDENLFNYLDVAVHDHQTLDIESKNDVNLDPTGEIKVYIAAPSLDKISVSGAAEVKTEGKFIQDKKIRFDISGASSGTLSLRAPVIELESTGASTLTADGECRDLKANASGAATINAYNLKSENSDADASGASTIRLFSSISLKAEASGASGIKYKGNPQVTSNVSGASSVGNAE